MKTASWVLIGSVALNLALLGVVGGRMLGGRASEHKADMQFERYGPTSDVVKAAWDQLPSEDRAQLSAELKQQWASMEPDRKLLKQAGQAVYDAAFSEPFDENRLRDAVTVFQSREARMQQAAEDILIAHLSKMPPVARATAAVGLLTPFNARVQRVDSSGKQAPGVATPDRMMNSGGSGSVGRIGETGPSRQALD
ncbi:MAG: periplasmic heavy metal sensor [Hyphomonadaceae bacterium]